MCGICGILDPRGVDNRRIVRAMCAALAHRGPDDEAVETGDGWALGHRRLSVIDLSPSGRQPIANEDRACFLACNGEIYNYLALREELIGCGHRFRSKSDSEVVLHLIEEYGPAGARRLNGMFAFAFLDTRRGVLMLCRDPFGIKPMCYAQIGPALVFASEIKALFQHPAIRPEMDRRRLREMLQFRYVGGEATLFAGVSEVVPGQLASWDLKTLRKESLDFRDALPARRGAGMKVAPAVIRESLAAAVERQLMSDVPLGVQVSGGLDSAMVTALAVRRRSEPTHSFSVSFRGAAADEFEWARLVSKSLGTAHHSVICTERQFLEDLALCAFMNDDPIAHPNTVPIRRMCEEARRHVTVVLTGEGADELFGGYSWQRRLWRLRRFGRLPSARILRGIERWGTDLPGIGRMTPLLGRSLREMVVNSGKWLDDALFDRIAHPELAAQEPAYRSMVSVPDTDALSAIMELDLRTYLPSVLRRQDRMSMAVGLEARVPFLDLEFAGVALEVPVEQLFEGGGSKAILRSAAEGLIPEPIIWRPKIGFRVPMREWMRQDHGLAKLLEWLTDDRAAERRLWRLEPISRLVDQHRRDRADRSDALWGLLALEIWARIWLDGASPALLSEQILRQAKLGSSRFQPSPRPRPAAESPAAGRSLRVCHVAPNLELGGMERMVCDLIEGLDKRGHVCQVFCTDAAGALFEKVRARARKYGTRKPGVFLDNLHVACDLAAFLRENGADIVHAHNHVAHLYAVLAAMFTGKPVVVTLHGQGYYDTRKVRFMRRLLMARTSRAVTVSRDIRERFIRLGVAPARKLGVIANGVSAERFAAARGPNSRFAARARLGIPAGVFVVGSIGRLAPEKNYPLLARAFAGLGKKPMGSGSVGSDESVGSDGILLLIGDGTERRKIEALADALGIRDRVLLPGAQDDVVPWLACMDVFCLSSVTEGTSLTLLEAAAAGLPLVATDVGGNAEIIEDGFGGFLAASGDEAALSAALARLRDEPGLRARMGDEARRIVTRDYSLAAMIDLYESLYHEALRQTVP
ncbi:MAG: asparagine synthase (glutamine-hydrolyzing) [Verrucomicrobiota bacterium]|nr:asparagine synthase (glutamine-hydrolyzing) [Verrucomicrobiota bacterium]